LPSFIVFLFSLIFLPQVMAQVTFAIRMPNPAGSGAIELITATESNCDEYCARLGEECVGVRETGTKARAMVFGNYRPRNPYRCQKIE